MKQQIFTRQEVIFLIKEILEYPDAVNDLIDNENSPYDAEQLLDLSITHCKKEQLKNGAYIEMHLILLSNIDSSKTNSKFCKNVVKGCIEKLL